MSKKSRRRPRTGYLDLIFICGEKVVVVESVELPTM
jgi:hypothetical protein